MNVSDLINDAKNAVSQETQDRFIATPTKIYDTIGYQVEQIHNDKTVVSQFVQDLAEWEEATGITVEIPDDTLII